jgi:hypothetical protein
MPSRWSLALLAATVVPVADLVLLIALVCVIAVAPDVLPPDPDRALLRALVLAHFAAGAWALVLRAVYWALLFRDRGVSWPRKAFWMLALFWLSGVAMPAFWYLHVWAARATDGE